MKKCIIIAVPLLFLSLSGCYVAPAPAPAYAAPPPVVYSAPASGYYSGYYPGYYYAPGYYYGPTTYIGVGSFGYWGHHYH